MKRYALVIGNSVDEATKGCNQDALNIKRLLLNRGFDKNNVFILKANYKNKDRNPSKESIERTLDYLSGVMTKNDILFYYYSGHVYRSSKDYGIPDGERDTFLVFSDGSRMLDDHFQQKWYDFPKKTLVFCLIDSCHGETAVWFNNAFIYKESNSLNLAKSLNTNLVIYSASPEGVKIPAPTRKGSRFTLEILKIISMYPKHTYNQIYNSVSRSNMYFEATRTYYTNLGKNQLNDHLKSRLSKTFLT